MTSAEYIIELRSIASDLTIRGAVPGAISPSLTYRIKDFLLRAGLPHGPWKHHRQYLTKPGTAIVNGEPRKMMVHEAVVDATVGEICREIVQILLLCAFWNRLPEYRDWNADRAESAIREAVPRLPEFCDRLESSPPELEHAAGAIRELARKFAAGEDATNAAFQLLRKVASDIDWSPDSGMGTMCKVEHNGQIIIPADEAYAFWHLHKILNDVLCWATHPDPEPLSGKWLDAQKERIRDAAASAIRSIESHSGDAQRIADVKESQRLVYVFATLLTDRPRLSTIPVEQWSVPKYRRLFDELDALSTKFKVLGKLDVNCVAESAGQFRGGKPAEGKSLIHLHCNHVDESTSRLLQVAKDDTGPQKEPADRKAIPEVALPAVDKLQGDDFSGGEPMPFIPAGFFPNQWDQTLSAFLRLVKQLSSMRAMLTECAECSAENSDVEFIVEQVRQELETLKFMANDAQARWATLRVEVATAIGRFSLGRPVDNVAWCESLLNSVWQFHNGLRRELSFDDLNCELCVQRLPLHVQRIPADLDQWPARMTAELRAGVLCNEPTPASNSSGEPTFTTIGHEFLSVSGADDVADRAVQNIAAKAYRLLRREQAAGNFRFDDYGIEYSDELNRTLNSTSNERKEYNAWQTVCLSLSLSKLTLSSDPNVARQKSSSLFTLPPADWRQRAKNYSDACFWLHSKIKPSQDAESPADVPDDSSWPTITQVAKGLDINKGTVSRLLKRGRLRDNSKTKEHRRVDPASVLQYCDEEGIAYNDS